MDSHHLGHRRSLARRAWLPLAIAVLAAAGLADATAASAATRVFPAVADATVQAKHPKRNAGRAHTLLVGRGRQAYLRFRVSLPSDEDLVSARLRLAPELPVTVRLAGNHWSERRITWRNRPRPRNSVNGFRRTGTITYVLTSPSRKPIRYASRERGGGPALVVTTRSTATATAGPTIDPSGESAPLGDFSGWRQVFVDDFSQDVPLGQFPEAVSSKWWAYPAGWKDTSKKGVYDPHRVLSVHNGVLDYFIHSENGVHYVAAPIPRLPGTAGGLTSTPSGQLYGRYSVRYRSTSLRGYKIAWLLWPDSKAFPRDGEIDFPEGDLDVNLISGYVHHQNGRTSWDQTTFHAWASPTEWHTATTEWLPGGVTYYLDGQVVGRVHTRVPDTPMHWVLQAETNTDGNPVPDSVAGSVQVDWVSVWAPAAG
jgi:beta-glucanase (GH16 family)